MKFQSEKKPSLCIYTNDVLPTADEKMEATLRRELGATKNALKLQTIRCRQLVAAFTRKLQEKESELRVSKDLRDQQLSRLLRALLILESRLKKEQKLIRQQLQDKDSIIERQEREIISLKRLESNRKWISPSEADTDSGTNGKRENVEWDPTEMKIPQTTGEERLDNLCRGIMDTCTSFKKSKHKPDFSKNSNNPITYVERCGGKLASCTSEEEKKKDNAYRDNPVLESVNQILLRDEEDLLKSVKPVTINSSEKVSKEQGLGSEWYETDSSLVVPEEPTETGAWCISVLEEDVEQELHPDNKNKKNLVWTKEKSSPTKSQHLEEKACLEMSKKTLTIAQHEDLEEVDTNKSDRSISPSKSEGSYQELLPVTKNITYQPVRNLQKPPALPPKPARLLKPSQLLQQKNNVHPRHRHAVVAATTTTTTTSTTTQKEASPAENSTSLEESNEGQNYQTIAKLNLNQTEQKRNGTSNFNQLPTSTRHRHPVPAVRTSAGSLPKESRSKSFDGIVTKFHVQEIKRNQMNGHIPGNIKPQETFDPSISKFEVVTASKTKMQDGTNQANCAAIRMGSSVSSLITGVSGNSIVTELSTGQSEDATHVTNLVHQFEKPVGKTDESNDIRKNFEEFKLEESYVESVIEGDDNGRPEGDGAETRNHYASLSIVPPPLPKEPPPPVVELDNRMYETFLETTGLSQKSILTPSRMLSNHRSCLKPKDVKHRSRIKAAAVIEKCNGGSTVKYWTEPFL